MTSARSNGAIDSRQVVNRALRPGLEQSGVPVSQRGLIEAPFDRRVRNAA